MVPETRDGCACINAGTSRRSLQKRLAVDHRPAGQPGERAETAHLDMCRLRIVLRMLLAVLDEPRAHVVLVLRAPARPAVDEQLVLRHYPPAATYSARCASF